jgi:hypothetical protein
LLSLSFSLSLSLSLVRSLSLSSSVKRVKCAERSFEIQMRFFFLKRYI